ncbi:MAG: CHASE2 domain-containing protein [Leptolyngbyaceae cyanobacterium bins.349]|nr:CHASE2 domain-containing protein [Leptolyngbyaceae cyanobacterium bins.349]
MPKSVVINLGTGDLYSGLPRVTAQVWAIDRSRPEQYIGSLPAAPMLVELVRDWRSLYQSLCYRHPLRSVAGLRQVLDDDLEIDHSGITNVSQVSFEQLSQSLQDALNTWLRSDPFLPIERQLRSQFSPTEEIRVVIETDDDLLRRLPWQRWDFFNDYPKAELALSCPEYQFRRSHPQPPRKKVRILAVLGNSQGIDLEQDAQFLKALKDAETQFLINPSRQEFNQQLWDERGWDILFFAGHSQTEGDSGRIYINDQPLHNSLTVAQFEAAIEGAISNGLKLAIFNSCDGLGLATALSCLHIPQAIVMREPVANRVAQAFFKCFLEAFAKQHLSLYLAVRQARQQLQGLEDEFPGASWLPVLCQNPAVEPAVWQDWCDQENGNQKAGVSRVGHYVLLLSLITAVCVMGVRWLGLLQPWELQIFDQLLRLRPPEPPDQRLLIITITEDDLHLPEQFQRQGSLSNLALAKLLQKLTPLKPRAIGLDVYQDFPFNSNSIQLAAELNRQPNFFAICKVADPEGDFPEIAPLPNLPSDRQGFSDVVTDADHVLRRHLLFMDRMPGAACSTFFALSTQLAFHYLKAEGISPRYTPQGNLQLGNHVFQRLHNHVGGYHQIDTAGYQILLNYRFAQASLSPAPTVTLKEALAGRLTPADVNDRIILIGVTALSSDDYVETPYGQRIPGVFIQAQMVSQLISAVKDGRPPITVWTWQIETLWVLGWAVLGGVLSWRYRSRFWRLGGEITAIGTLVIIGFYGLRQNQWVPLVPAAFGFLITSRGVAFIIGRDYKQR